ncbi:MAG: YIP1 family protein [Chlamydiota bacterium]
MAEPFSETPFLLIWKNPRKAMQLILASNPRYLNFSLAFVTSIDRLLFQANQESLGIHHDYIQILGLCVLGGLVYAFFWLYAFGAILHCMSKLFGGKAPFSHTRAALAWAGAPELLSLCVWFALLLFSPEDTFIKMTDGTSLLFLYLIMFIPTVWSLGLSIINLQEAQHLSLGKAIANWLLFWACFLGLQQLGIFEVRFY